MIYFFIAPGFEEIEALCPIDILRRAGLDVVSVGIGGREITGAHGITYVTDITDAEYDNPDAELIFLPGGMPGTINLANSETVTRAIEKADRLGSYIAAICAAPMILGQRGLLREKEAICYPGFEDKLVGAVVSEKCVVRDGNILTAKGMGVALDFALMIVELLCGTEKATELRHTVIAD